MGSGLLPRPHRQHAVLRVDRDRRPHRLDEVLRGCAENEDIVQVLGFQMSDLFSRDSKLYRYGEANGAEWMKSRGPNKKFRTEKGFPAGTVLLYRTEEVEAANSSVIVVEGEKDTDTLIEMSLTAVGLPSASWRPFADAVEVFRGKEVTLWPDADDAGAAAMTALASALHGVARSVRLVEVTDLPSGCKDVSDVAAIDQMAVYALLGVARVIDAPDPTLPGSTASSTSRPTYRPRSCSTSSCLRPTEPRWCTGRVGAARATSPSVWRQCWCAR